MARNIVPRVSGEETLGTPGKEFGAVYTQRIAGGSLEQIKALLAKYLPLSGGAITGVILVGNCSGMAKATNDRELYLYGGTTNQDGAAIGLRGINFTGYGEQLRGSFGIAAVHPSGTVHTLNGLGDGRLLWDDINIGAGGVVAKMFGQTGYIKYASGLIIQWGLSGSPINHISAITFPVAFSTLTYTVMGIAALGNGDFGERSIGIRGESKTHHGCEFYVARVDSPSAHYFAIGI